MACVYLAEAKRCVLHLFGWIPCSCCRRAYYSVDPRWPLLAGKTKCCRNLLPDAERAEDQIQDVVGRGRAGDGIERAQRVIEVEQQHLVRNIPCHSFGSSVERQQRILD